MLCKGPTGFSQSEIRKPFVLLGFFPFLLPFLPFYADATSARWYLCKLETHLQ